MFSFASPQAMHFGRGQRHIVAGLAAGYGQNVLVGHGANAARAAWLLDALRDAGLTVRAVSCAGEPSLPDLAAALDALDGFRADVVIGLGGGAALDFAKALAALIPCNGDPRTYLEVVGDGRALDAAPVPMIALPTTAGTGAEVTKNAVITVPDAAIKVSLRDARMIPQVAVVDPDLMQGAPKSVALAAGLDAVTQVIEPYLTRKANPMTDAICAAAIPVGLGAIRDLVENDAPAAWDSMAWVSTCGGLALANAGLGAVHGFAGVIGGRTGAPHGEICATLLPPVLRSHRAQAGTGSATRDRLDWITGLLDQHFGDGVAGAGVDGLSRWTRSHGLRSLSQMGLDAADHSAVARDAAGASSMKGNPFALSQAELLDILADQGG